MYKNNKITIVGYSLSILSFLVSLFCFVFKFVSYGKIFLALGLILSGVIGVYKMIINESKN